MSDQWTCQRAGCPGSVISPHIVCGSHLYLCPRCHQELVEAIDNGSLTAAFTRWATEMSLLQWAVNNAPAVEVVAEHSSEVADAKVAFWRAAYAWLSTPVDEPKEADHD